MGKILLGVNMEFVRHHDKPFDWGVAKAAEIGYQYVEPMVHWGRELLSEARYFHSVSMYDDVIRRHGARRLQAQVHADLRQRPVPAGQRLLVGHHVRRQDASC